jgi:hypothetical protein
MTRLNQKQKELNILNLFLKFNEFESKYIVQENEQPDFILIDKINRSKTGVEITEFFNDFSKKGSYDNRENKHFNKVFNETKEFIKENYLNENLEFTITYRHTEDKLLDFNSESIKKIMIENEPFENDVQTIKINSKNLEQIVVKKKEGDSCLISLSITDYNKINEETIQCYIETKSELQKKWNFEFDKKWLIIHTGYEFSNNFNNPKELKNDYGYYKNYWDKIYLMFPTEKGESIELLK